MAPRASWKGQLKLSLVSFPVRLHNAVSAAHTISLNQLHKDCNRRVRQQMTCPEHGAIDRSDIVKGYEFEKGKYVVVDDGDLARLKLETTKTIELLYFIDEDVLDPMYLNSSYYVAPDGLVADEAFRVFHNAMKQHGKVGIGRVVMTNREHIVALRVEGVGFVLTTLRYASEVRSASAYFEDIGQGDLRADHMQLAEQLIEANSAEFDTSAFKDRYQDALLELVKAKLEGAEPAIPQEEEAGKVINLMEALKASVEKGALKKPPAKSVKRAKKSTKTAKAKRA
jgi:DNA end-binding protein Ku